MTKLKLGPIADNKPVKVTLELPAKVHRDLTRYAEMLASETRGSVDAVRLIAPMLEQFMTSDRQFIKKKRESE